MTNKTIAFIFSQFPCYDETFILRELNQLKKTGLRFRIYSLKTPPPGQIVHEEARDLAATTVYLPFLSFGVLRMNLFYLFRYPARYLSTFWLIIRGNAGSFNFLWKTLVMWPKAVGFAWLLRRQGVRHVHGQWATYPATTALIISRLNKGIFTFTGHAHDIYMDTTMLDTKLCAAKFVTTCTADNKRHLLNVARRMDPDFDAEKIIINYHGIDLSRFRFREKNKNNAVFHILSVGSLLKAKGFPYLVEACRILKDEGVPFRCTIAGGGPLEISLKRQINRLNLKEDIELTGYIKQEHLLPLYQQADMFILLMIPGLHWGIPNVLVEAAASGLPVVCTLLDPVPELIQNGKTGFIVPAKDPRTVAEVIQKLYKDPNLRQEVTRSARKVVEKKFDTVRNSEQLRDLFLNCKTDFFNSPGG